jgi:hypothetical protein
MWAPLTAPESTRMRELHMTYRSVVVALFAPVLVAMSDLAPPNLSSADSMRRKCRNSAQQNLLYFMDGRSSDSTELHNMDQRKISYVVVACLNTTDSTLLASSSPALGIPAMIVWTKASPFEQIKPTLKALRDAQDTRFAQTGAYSADLAALRLPALPAEVKIMLNVTESGWNATAWVDRRLSPRCRVFHDVKNQDRGSVDAISCD